MDGEEEQVRAPIEGTTDTLLGNDYQYEPPETVESRIQKLMESGLTQEEAEQIAKDQFRIAKDQQKIMNRDSAVATMQKKIKEAEERTLYENNRASQEASSSKEAELLALEQHVNKNYRKFAPKILQYIRDAFESKRKNGIKSVMEISDQKFKEIQNEINGLIERKLMTADDREAILDLFTTPSEDEGSEYTYESGNESGIDSGYDTSGGRRTRTRKYRKRRKNRKSRKSKKSRKSRKSRKSKKNKRK